MLKQNHINEIMAKVHAVTADETLTKADKAEVLSVVKYRIGLLENKNTEEIKYPVDKERKS